MTGPNKLRGFYVLAVPVLALAGVIAYQSMHNHAKPTADPETTAAASVSPMLPAADVQEKTRTLVEASYGRLPLSFEPNRGQSDPQVRFLSHAGRRTLWLTHDEAVLAIGRPSRTKARDRKTSQAKPAAPAVLRMKFTGANSHPQIAGEDKQPGTVNYFFGKPNEWRTKVPTYARVRYRSLYPGIDLVFYGNNRELEYDLVVSPGADPSRIKFAISGAEDLRIDANGNLVLKTAAGDLIQQKPKIYQRKGTKMTAVPGNYVINGKNEVGFRLGSYDRRAAVVIDPVLRYASYLAGGGDEDDAGTGIAVDSSNHAVVSGWTNSFVFPGETGSAVPVSFSPAAFVTKFNFSGTGVIFSAFVAGSQFFDNNPVALDAAGNIYLAGSTFGNAFGQDTFIPTAGAFQETFGGETDAWVVKLNSTGTKVMYATFLGGSGDERAGGIAVDSDGNAYVTGSTTSKNFPVTSGVFQPACKLKNGGNCASAFVTKLNALGTKALYSTYLGGHGTQTGEGIALNGSGNAFVTGQTDATDFPTTAGTEQPALKGGLDAFVTQFSSSGSHLNFSTFLGGTGSDGGTAIALDSTGNAFITGKTESTNFPLKNAFLSNCSGGCSFASKFNPNFQLLYSTLIGPGGGTSIAVTPGGQAFVAGDTVTDFQTTQNAFQRVLPPEEFGGGTATNSIFITKLTPTGKLSYASFLGGGVDSPRVALDKSTNAYLTGIVGFPPFGTIPVTPGAFQTERIAELDAFVAKVIPLCALSSVDRSVTICSPGDGSTVQSPVNIVAGTTDVTPVKLTQIYLDGKKIFEARLSAINVNLPIANGTHRLTVQAFDTNNVIFKKTIHMTVSSQAAPCALNPVNRTVTICSPADGATVKSPVNVVAGTTDTTPVKLLQIYLDGQKAFEVKSASLNTSLAMADGTHRLTVQAIDTANAIFKKTINITVSSQAGAPCALNPVNRTVTICSPADGATVKSPVNVVAGTTDSTPVKLMQIYLDGQKAFEVKSASLDVNLAMGEGTHRLTVQAIDAANAIFKKTINITVSQ